MCETCGVIDSYSAVKVQGQNNGIGAVATGIVAVIIAGTKFIYGAWIVILIIPILVFMFRSINRHYRRVEAELRTGWEHKGEATEWDWVRAAVRAGFEEEPTDDA